MRLQSNPSKRSESVNPRGHQIPLHGLAVLRILIILVIGIGYASTMLIGPESSEWGAHWGYDPSWYGIQLLFIFSGFLAVRSMMGGKSLFGFLKSRTLSLWPALTAATLISVCVIYPIMCAPDAPVRMSAMDLVSYTLKTIFLIDPGSRMPGLLDDALYMCLLQGGLWTLRIGLILHIGFLIGWRSGILRRRWLVLALSVISIAAYVFLVDLTQRDDQISQIIDPFLPAMRLGYAYLAGVSLYFWQDKLRLNKGRIILSGLVLAFLTSAYYMWLPWSAAIEVMGVTVWLTLCLGFLYQAPNFFQRCPRLSPVLYVTIWPAAQIIVALFPELSQGAVIETTLLLSSASAGAMFLLLRQARIQPARL